MSASSALGSGCTLPVWVAVAAVAAVRQLRGDPLAERVGLELLQPAGQRQLDGLGGLWRPVPGHARAAPGGTLANSSQTNEICPTAKSIWLKNSILALKNILLYFQRLQVCSCEHYIKSRRRKFRHMACDGHRSCDAGRLYTE